MNSLISDDDPVRIRRSLFVALSTSLFVCQFQSDANVPAVLFGVEDGFKNVNPADVLVPIWLSILYLTWRYANNFLTKYLEFRNARAQAQDDVANAKSIISQLSEKLLLLKDHSEVQSAIRAKINRFESKLKEVEEGLMPMVFELGKQLRADRTAKEQQLVDNHADAPGITEAYAELSLHQSSPSLKKLINLINSLDPDQGEFSPLIDMLNSLKLDPTLKEVDLIPKRKFDAANIIYFDFWLSNGALPLMWIAALGFVIIQFYPDIFSLEVVLSYFSEHSPGPSP